MELKKQQALETFNWWLNQAKDYLLSTRNSGISRINHLAQCCLQQTAEFTFKAIITSLTNRELKTRDPYVLICHALQHIPEINLVFPRNTDHEKKLFHYLNPAFLLERGSIDLVPDGEDLQLLLKQVSLLISTVESAFSKKFNYHTKPH
jgi:hypothetical protein